MGFRESFGPFFGMSARKINTQPGRFDLNKKNNTTDFKKAAGNLTRLDRAKLLGMLKEEGKLGKTLSNRQVMDIMRKRGDPRAYRERVKDQVLTPRILGIDEKQIRRNIRMTTFDRLKEEAKANNQETQGSGLVEVNQPQEKS